MSSPRSGPRILVYLAGSVALLLATWLALQSDAASTAREPVEPVAEVRDIAPVDPAAARRLFTDFDEESYRVAHAALPPEDLEARVRAHRNRPPPSPPDPAVLAAAAAAEAALPVVTTELADALEARRSTLRRTCSRGGDSSTLYVTATFAPDGKLSEHSVIDDTAPEVAACVQQQIASLTIPPPGVEITTRSKFQWP